MMNTVEETLDLISKSIDKATDFTKALCLKVCESIDVYACSDMIADHDKIVAISALVALIVKVLIEDKAISTEDANNLYEDMMQSMSERMAKA